MALIEKLNAIGDAIREKTGGTDKLTLDGMVEAIAGIQSGGAKVSCGSFSVSSGQTYTIEHGLGAIPTAIFCFVDTASSLNSYYNVVAGGYWLGKSFTIQLGASGKLAYKRVTSVDITAPIVNNGVFGDATETTVTFGSTSSDYKLKGPAYSWVAIAGSLDG